MTPEELDTFWSKVDGEWVRVEEMEQQIRAAVEAEREQSRELREAALEVVGLIEAWEEAVRRIIGRIPETGIDLNRLKAAIRQADDREEKEC